jgi:hypothetical protein
MKHESFAAAQKLTEITTSVCTQQQLFFLIYVYYSFLLIRSLAQLGMLCVFIARIKVSRDESAIVVLSVNYLHRQYFAFHFSARK